MANPSSRNVIFAALAGNSLIAVTKFVAAATTGSAAMMSEGIHSLVDTGNQGLLLYGMRRASRPADAQHPYGYGKEIYFYSFVVAIMIFAVGAGVAIYEGVHHVLHPEPAKNVMVSLSVLAAAMIFEGGAWYFAFKEFKKAKGKRSYIQAVQEEKDPSIFVVLFEDSAAMLGLVVAAVGIGLSALTGNPVFDGIASILIGCILGGTAWWLAYETKGLLIGESARPTTVLGIKEIVSKHPAINSIRECLTLHMGPDYVLLNLSLEFKDDLKTGDIESTVSVLDVEIKNAFPRIKKVFIEAEAEKL